MFVDTQEVQGIDLIAVKLVRHLAKGLQDSPPVLLYCFLGSVCSSSFYLHPAVTDL